MLFAINTKAALEMSGRAAQNISVNLRTGREFRGIFYFSDNAT